MDRLVRTFDINSDDFTIYVRKNEEEFKELSRKELDFFNVMDTIITFGDDYAGLIDKVQQNSILPKYKYTIKYEDLN